MTVPRQGPDLDDPAALIEGDRDGLLHSAASAGAHARAMAAEVSGGALERIAGLRPRAVVFVAGPGTAGSAGSVAAAALAPRLDVPVVRAERIPEWAGPLDLVVVLGDDPGDPEAALAIAESARRGAEAVVTIDPEGPVGAAFAAGTASLAPRLPMRGAHRFLHHLLAAAVVLAVARPERGRTWFVRDDPAAGLAELADLIDAEALQDAPGRETFDNPAKRLAAAMRGRDVIVAGDDSATVALARHLAADALSTAGIAAAAVALTELLAAPGGRGGAGGFRSAEEAIFHDEQIDGPLVAPAGRTFVLATDGDEPRVRARLAARPDADVLSLGGTGAAAATTMGQFSVLALRWRMAVAYLRISDTVAAGPGTGSGTVPHTSGDRVTGGWSQCR